MSELLPEGANLSVSGLEADVELEAVDAADTISGSPEQGVAELGSIGGTALGIWELRGGTVTDTEVDELFVVLSGGATIEFLDETRADGSPRMVEVKAGDVMRLVAGSRTRWSVEDHIRKVYIAEA
ncbi:cupin domain-containing protein [Leucobacter denitrificans]|uniref:Cupin domain-containing protein n=1 Tax=Leucobacter denitrificans TaxID=683042 RepID=A0A7G9S3X2_9MICO|nr:cupin domain-containing protein [Leucobacter denitrificans]QNN62547.1 cupin domain-containing protein [Leucobacter denitrificans]